MSRASLALDGIRQRICDMLGAPVPLPFSIALSVTNRCTSRCKVCSIWRLTDHAEEFESWEWEKLIAQIGPYVKFYTISGGEPFLREDLADLLYMPFKFGKPHYLTISTNCLFPEKVRDQIERLLLRIERKTSCTIYCNLSVDGIGGVHDQLRGIAGNFSSVLETIGYLSEIRSKSDNVKFRIGIHTVISKLNLKEVEKICDFFLPLEGIDTLICEIAEQRKELHNSEESYTPSREEFLKVTNLITNRLSDVERLDKTVTWLREGYYQFVDEWLKTGRQPLSCFAGQACCQVTPTGEIVACGTRWVENGLMGSLREQQYDFKRIWYSDQAEMIRRSIRKKECACPLCNTYYASLICNPISLVKMFLRSRWSGSEKRIKPA